MGQRGVEGTFLTAKRTNFWPLVLNNICQKCLEMIFFQLFLFQLTDNPLTIDLFKRGLYLSANIRIFYSRFLIRYRVQKTFPLVLMGVLTMLNVSVIINWKYKTYIFHCYSKQKESNRNLEKTTKICQKPMFSRSRWIKHDNRGILIFLYSVFLSNLSLDSGRNL